jgi:hypothetical protein
MIKIIIICIIFVLSFLISDETFYINDYNFTNQNYNIKKVWKFVKTFKYRALDYADVEVIVRGCHLEKIHPLVVLVKMQTESGLLNVKDRTFLEIRHLRHRAMAYGIYKNFRIEGKKFYEFGGYDIQVFMAIKLFRKLFNGYKKGKSLFIYDLGRRVIPENASTYSLMRYMPFYGHHDYYSWGLQGIGNKGFERTYIQFRKRWKTIK